MKTYQSVVIGALMAMSLAACSSTNTGSTDMNAAAAADTTSGTLSGAATDLPPPSTATGSSTSGTTASGTTMQDGTTGSVNR